MWILKEHNKHRYLIPFQGEEMECPALGSVSLGCTAYLTVVRNIVHSPMLYLSIHPFCTGWAVPSLQILPPVSWWKPSCPTRWETLRLLNGSFMYTGKALSVGIWPWSFCCWSSWAKNLLFLSRDPLSSLWALTPQVLALQCPNLSLVLWCFSLLCKLHSLFFLSSICCTVELHSGVMTSFFQCESSPSACWICWEPWGPAPLKAMPD